MIRFRNKTVVAAVRTDEEFAAALKSGCKLIFDLTPNIHKISARIFRARQCGKRMFLHVDLSEGIGKDAAGLDYIKGKGADGIISTRASIIKSAKETGLLTVQRFFMIDSQSVSTALETLRTTKADMIEIMPGLLPKVIERTAAVSSVPVIAGGLIESREDILAAFAAGASAVSTGKRELWR